MKHLGQIGGDQEIATGLDLIAKSNQVLSSSREVSNAASSAYSLLINLIDSTGVVPNPFVTLLLDPSTQTVAFTSSDGTISSSISVTPTGIDLTLPAGSDLKVNGSSGTEGQYLTSRGPGATPEYRAQITDFGTFANPAED